MKLRARRCSLTPRRALASRQAGRSCHASATYGARRCSTAIAGIRIGEYWIVNIGARTVEVYSSPDGDRYAETRTLRDTDPLRPAALPGVMMTVAEILPKA